uniref:Uncharacterized protein n=1 Tax=Rhizophagus irregularis (strain DAOM 181602 / DAOM 197198 / MUCL 43194) TaxID=747089 RepID=U9U8K8_RHIID
MVVGICGKPVDIMGVRILDFGKSVDIMGVGILVNPSILWCQDFGKPVDITDWNI